MSRRTMFWMSLFIVYAQQSSAMQSKEVVITEIKETDKDYEFSLPFRLLQERTSKQHGIKLCYGFSRNPDIKQGVFVYDTKTHVCIHMIEDPTLTINSTDQELETEVQRQARRMSQRLSQALEKPPVIVELSEKDEGDGKAKRSSRKLSQILHDVKKKPIEVPVLRDLQDQTKAKTSRRFSTPLKQSPFQDLQSMKQFRDPHYVIYDKAQEKIVECGINILSRKKSHESIHSNLLQSSDMVPEEVPSLNETDITFHVMKSALDDFKKSSLYTVYQPEIQASSSTIKPTQETERKFTEREGRRGAGGLSLRTMLSSFLRALTKRTTEQSGKEINVLEPVQATVPKAVQEVPHNVTPTNSNANYCREIQSETLSSDVSLGSRGSKGNEKDTHLEGKDITLDPTVARPISSPPLNALRKAEHGNDIKPSSARSQENGNNSMVISARSEDSGGEIKIISSHQLPVKEEESSEEKK